MRRDAFSYVEVLVALAILLALVLVTGGTLFQVLNAEQRADRLQAASLVVDRLTAHRLLGTEGDPAFADWVLEPVEAEAEAEETPVAWQTWRVREEPRGGVVFDLSFQFVPADASPSP